MDHHSTLIRNVEVPSTLPPLETLTKLTGSILLKETTPVEEGLRVEGDLLWRGYFEEGNGDCLWEGAEFFSEILRDDSRGEAEVAPTILSLEGTATSADTYRLTFDIRWFAPQDDDAPDELYATDAVPRPTEDDDVTTDAAVAAETEELRAAAVTATTDAPDIVDGDATSATDATVDAPAATLEEGLDRADASWRRTLKVLNETATGERPRATEVVEEADADDEEATIKCCPYSKFCLRYYRTQDGDELERIAERFSATVAKLKEFNHLDNAPLPSGRLLRIP